MSALETMRVPAIDHCPTIDQLERAAELVVTEAERLLERAREELCRVQDAAAELEDAFGGGALLVRNRAAWNLRKIARQLTRSQCALVHEDDERHAAARQVFRWADEAEPSDAPWRDAA